jgi:hypothetical protein
VASLADDRRPGAGRALAVALALSIHAVLFAGLLWRFEAVPKDYAPPVISVELTRPRWMDIPRRRSYPPADSPVAARTFLPPPRPELAPAPADQPPGPGAAPPSDPEGGSAGLRQTLRGVIGCDHAGFLGLSAAERQHCQDRLARDQTVDVHAARPGLDLSRRGAFAKRDGPDPFLAREPKNGCAPNVKETETGTAGAVRQDWTAGINCAWAF